MDMVGREKQVGSTPKTTWKPSFFVCGLWRGPYKPPSNMRLLNRLAKPWCRCHSAEPWELPNVPACTAAENHPSWIWKTRTSLTAVFNKTHSLTWDNGGQWEGSVFGLLPLTIIIIATMAMAIFIRMIHCFKCNCVWHFGTKSETQSRFERWHLQKWGDESELISSILAFAYLRQNFKW